MSQRGVHLVIGRLVTDGVFRRRVERGGSAYLAGLSTEGVDLNRAEIASLIEVDPRVWTSVAKQIDRAGNDRADRTASEDGSSGVHRSLTARQQRVLAGVCDGLRNQQIAAELGVSESAVKASLQQIFRKLSVRTRVQLVRLALDESARSLSGRGNAGANGPGVVGSEPGEPSEPNEHSRQRAVVVAGRSRRGDRDERGPARARANGAHLAGGARQV